MIPTQKLSSFLKAYSYQPFFYEHTYQGGADLPPPYIHNFWGNFLKIYQYIVLDKMPKIQYGTAHAQGKILGKVFSKSYQSHSQK